MNAAELATKGCFYRRQLSFGILDLTLHSGLTADQLANLPEFSNKILGEVFLPPDPSTAVIASFDHLMGYGAGYYGYAWADAIAADMASVFQSAPDGFLDAKIGRRLRDEIYAEGNSRDITVSIEKFLRRNQSIDPFLKAPWDSVGTVYEQADFVRRAADCWRSCLVWCTSRGRPQGRLTA